MRLRYFGVDVDGTLVRVPTAAAEAVWPVPDWSER